MKLEEMRASMEKGKFGETAKSPAPKVIERAKDNRSKKTDKETRLLKEIALGFISGNSDKVYIIRMLLMNDGRYAVKAKWGRRGSGLRTVSKFSSASYPDVGTHFDNLVKEKSVRDIKR